MLVLARLFDPAVLIAQLKMRSAHGPYVRGGGEPVNRAFWASTFGVCMPRPIATGPRSAKCGLRSCSDRSRK